MNCGFKVVNSNKRNNIKNMRNNLNQFSMCGNIVGLH